MSEWVQLSLVSVEYEVWVQASTCAGQNRGHEKG